MSLTDEDKLWLTERMDALGDRLVERMDALEQRIVGRMDGRLTSFPTWGTLLEQKLGSHREGISAADPEIEAMGNRVAKLEADRDRLH